MPIYKLLLSSEWQALQAHGETAGAPVDVADGFIHFSTSEQVLETANKHFAHITEMWVLTMDESAMGSALRWEPSRGGALFPHLYGPLALEHVTHFVRVTRSEGTPWAFPV